MRPLYDRAHHFSLSSQFQTVQSPNHFKIGSKLHCIFGPVTKLAFFTVTGPRLLRGPPGDLGRVCDAHLLPLVRLQPPRQQQRQERQQEDRGRRVPHAAQRRRGQRERGLLSPHREERVRGQLRQRQEQGLGQG